MSQVSCLTSHVSRLMSHVSRLMSHVSCLTSHILWKVRRNVYFWAIPMETLTRERKTTRMVSFDNTEIAFSGKSDADLRRSYWLFKIISSPRIVKLGSGLTNFALAIHFPIKWMIKPTIFKQFVGGENIAECTRTINQLGKFNIGTILDYSVEGKETEEDFDRGA